MQSGPFIKLIASTYGVPEKTVTVIARVMREAGWITTTGARGVNAPYMQAQDAARLSIALLTGEPPSKVIEEFEFIRTLRTNADYPEEGLVTSEDLRPGHNFEDAVVCLFEAMEDSSRLQKHSDQSWGFDILPKVLVSVNRSSRTASASVNYRKIDYEDLDGKAEIEILAKAVISDHDAWSRRFEIEDRSNSGGVVAGRGLRVVRTITEIEIEPIAKALLSE